MTRARDSSKNLHAFPQAGEDMISFEDYTMIFIRGIFRELLTQLAYKLKEAMALAMQKGSYQTMNRHLNNY